MATVAAEHFPLEETYGRKSPGQQRKFEHESHQENQHQECVHIGIQRKLVFNCGAELVFVKKPQGDGKNEKIAYGDSDEKHDGAEKKRRARTLYFVVIKGRFDKAPQEIEHERKGERERQPERCAEMCEKLGGEVDVDNLDFKSFRGKLRKVGKQTGDGGKKAVKHEVAVARPHDDVVENVGHVYEKHDHKDDKHSCHLEQHFPQIVKMAPEGFVFPTSGIISFLRFSCLRRQAC